MSSVVSGVGAPREGRCTGGQSLYVGDEHRRERAQGIWFLSNILEKLL